jgi:hypothetical protein
VTDCRPCSMSYWPNFSHCMTCHRTWHGYEECHCAGCHQHFASDSSFLMHQTADECRDPATIVDRDGVPRLKQVQRKDGSVWVANRDSRPLRAMRSPVGSDSGEGVAS